MQPDEYAEQLVGISRVTHDEAQAFFTDLWDIMKEAESIRLLDPLFEAEQIRLEYLARQLQEHCETATRLHRDLRSLLYELEAITGG